MSDIEKLTDEERATLAWPMPHRAEAKALRIIDAQAGRIAELESELAKIRGIVRRYLDADDRARSDELSEGNVLHMISRALGEHYRD